MQAGHLLSSPALELPKCRQVDYIKTELRPKGLPIIHARARFWPSWEHLGSQPIASSHTLRIGSSTHLNGSTRPRLSSSIWSRTQDETSGRCLPKGCSVR